MKHLVAIAALATLAACGGGGGDSAYHPQDLPLVPLKGFPLLLVVQGCYHPLTAEGLCSVIDTYTVNVRPGAFCRVPIDAFDQSCPIEQFVYELAPPR